MKLSASEYLAIAIGTAMSGGGGYQYEGISTCQSGKDVEQFTVVVHPRALYWSCTSLRTGNVQSFDPHTLTLHNGEDSRQLSVDRIPYSFPEAVQLAFPLSLSIWGRHQDEYHPISAEEQEQDIVLILRHHSDKGLFGSFTFDRESGRAKRLATPTRLLNHEVKLPDASSGPQTSNFGFVSGAGQNT